MNAFEQYEVWFVTGAQLLYVNPAKRNVMVVKNEMRLLKQKRNVLQI